MQNIFVGPVFQLKWCWTQRAKWAYFVFMDRNSNDDKLIDRDYQQLKDVTWSRGLTDIKVIPLSLQATTSTFNLETHLYLKMLVSSLFTQLNSHTDGLAVARLYGFDIAFMTNPIYGSAAWFFVICLKFILTFIFQIRINRKKFLGTFFSSKEKLATEDHCYSGSWKSQKIYWENLTTKLN